MREIYRQARLARDRRFDGSFFVAVRSTGIFCRPVCPAVPPKESNVEYFQAAALALEAGYRPCLRCRPDSAPESWAWKGVDTSVERALRLLGQHPELNLGQIAARLGIGERYLRKLFQQRVGLAPKRYQLFQQLLFAKKLLHQTGLEVEQVAQAAGFNSARRLQDNFRRHLRLSPSQVRGGGKADGALQLRLQFRPPYDWPRLRDMFAGRAIPGMEWVDEHSYARTFVYQGQPGWFKADYLGEQQGFLVRLELERLEGLKAVVGEIRRVLDLDADAMLIDKALRRAGLPRARVLPGLRLPGTWTAFEAACRAVLGQQVSVRAAVGKVSQLVEQLGEDCAHGKLFPAPEAVAASDLSFLRMPAARRETLRALARYWCRHGEPEDPAGLLALRGIGPWTVAYLRMRGRSDPDIWLQGDLVLHKAMQKLDLQPELAAPWRSYLTLQLWNLS